MVIDGDAMVRRLSSLDVIDTLNLTMKYNGAPPLQTRRARCRGPDDGKSTATQSINTPFIQRFEIKLCTRKRLGLLWVDVIGASDGPIDHERRADRDIPNHPGLVQ